MRKVNVKTDHAKREKRKKMEGRRGGGTQAKERTHKQGVGVGWG